MNDNDLDSLVETVGKQVAEFAQRIEDEEIIDPEQLGAFVKLGNYYNRLRESAGQNRVRKEDDNGEPDIDAMSDFEFLDKYYAGEFDEWVEEWASQGYGDPSYPRMLLVSDESWMKWESRRPKLRIPVLLHIPT
jgi:hypothetical protein